MTSHRPRRWRCARLLPLCAVLLQSLLSGQSQPGQYPPNQYPPDQRPSDPNVPVYQPNRLPGGIQLPPIRWPKRKQKDDSKKEERSGATTSESNLRSMEGNLRSLAAKHLLVDTGRAVFRFRLLAATRFVDKANQPVRDSLLQPGDFLSVQVNADDPETAVRVTLLRSGSDDERAAAAKPVDAAAIRTPELADVGGAPADAAAPRRRARSQRTEDDDGDEPARPVPTRPQSNRDESAARRQSGEATTLHPDEQILADAREAAMDYGDDMPNFVAEQVTTRSVSMVDPPDWRTLDVITAEVSCVDSKEQYSKIKVNGRPFEGSIEKTGAWSTGEFSTTLDDLFDPSTGARFVRTSDGRAASRPAYVYEFSVDQSASPWTLVAENGARHRTAYSGRVWIDKASRRVLRIEQTAEGLPASFGLNRAESFVEFGFVRIESGTFLLPQQGETMGCKTGTSQCSRNAIEFRSYWRFGADSKITF